jgi:chromosomal replication initiator protein
MAQPPCPITPGCAGDRPNRWVFLAICGACSNSSPSCCGPPVYSPPRSSTDLSQSPSLPRPLLQESITAAVNPELEQIWSHVQGKLTEAVDEPTYRVWLQPLNPSIIDNERLVLEAHPQACGWIRERFGRLLQSCAATVLGPNITVDVIPCAEQTHLGRRPAAAIPRRNEKSSPAHPTIPSTPQPEPLGNPRFAFEQFVIGDSNRLAHAAALAVAELPGQAYNPLFICGPPGVGKTHLLRAIGSLVLNHSPGLNVRYTTGEAFTTEFRSAVGGGRMDGFKASFRQLDVLLIDDVQFLERKARTEEEFFHTFNALHEAGAQLVLSSDRPPRDLQALEDRLRERFQAGLVADIQPPDINTRIAVLRKRANHDSIQLSDPLALNVIAERITHNIRALEGALIRTVAYGSLTGRPLTVALATEVLDNLYPRTISQQRSLADIQTAACKHFGLSSEELLSASRTTRISWPRQVAMYLARELTTESLPSIGRHFGGRDHTTVIHACRRTEQRILTDASCRQTVDSLRQHLL